MWRELAEGFRYVVSVPWLWRGIMAAALVLMLATAPFTSLLPTIVRDDYGLDVGAYGLLFSLLAVGMVGGLARLGTLEPAEAPDGDLLHGARDQRPRNHR